MLAALKRWRKFQGMSAFPTPADNAPLFPLHRGTGPIGNTTHIRNIVQGCYDRAVENLAEQGFKEEAEAMMDARVHWLRHTCISDDVKIRRPGNMSEMMQATVLVLSLIVTSMLSSRSGTNRLKRRKFGQIENSGINANDFIGLSPLNGNSDPLMFWEPIWTNGTG